ncbi:MAG: nucleotidyltransferase [Bdellovibrio sp. CG10_big_fil_rev_8_21_14_0_10_47_8]|nr:MAG: nucleotidyltransferase [Bdellovibrio sp. CG10_big_fil_rev_8_21_14_0_10_47_8]
MVFRDDPSKIVEDPLTTSEEFQRSVSRLKEALEQPKTEFIRDSVIQRFEFSVELAWKTSKKIMGTATSAPKDVIREMAQSNYIQDVDRWLKAIDMRNLSSHTYKEDLAEQVFSFVQEFFPELQKLAEGLKNK